MVEDVEVLENVLDEQFPFPLHWFHPVSRFETQVWA